MESVVLYLRNEIFLPALGGRTATAYIPFVLTLFFFILFMNLMGLHPVRLHAHGQHQRDRRCSPSARSWPPRRRG